MKPVLLLLAACMLPGPATVFGQAEQAGQEKRVSDKLGLRIGLHSSRTQDLLFSPLIYRGTSLAAVQLGHQRRSRKSFHALSGAFDRISVRSAPSLAFPFFNRTIRRRASTASSFNLQYGYARAVLQKGNLDLRLGGLLDGRMHLVEYRFADAEDESYFLTYALGAWLRGTYWLGTKQALHLETSFPLVAFVSRPPFAVVDNKEIQSTSSGFVHVHRRGELQAPGDLVRLHLLVSYTRSVSARFDVLLAYQFDYTRFADPQAISIVRNGFDAGLVLNF